MFSILVLAGSSVVPLPLVVSASMAIFVGAFAGGIVLTRIVSALHLRWIRRVLGLGAVAVLAATPSILSDVCNFCWWCIDCWF